MEQNSEDNQVELTIDRPGRVLHFSDGVDEEVTEELTTQLESSAPVKNEVDPQALTWGPWFSHYLWKSGSKVLDAVDYAGEGLASFFGITTPKYQIEINEYERMQEEKRRMEAEEAGWVPKTKDSDIPLVNEPVRSTPQSV